MLPVYLLVDVLRKTQETFSSADVAHSLCTTHLFARRLIASAFDDAVKCRDGPPTAKALEAVEWLQADSDWTAIPLTERLKRWGAPAPPPDVRREYAGTCSWACGWLSEDPDVVRKLGLKDPGSPPRHGREATAAFARRRQGLPAAVTSVGRLGGLPVVFEVWRAAAEAWENRTPEQIAESEVRHQQRSERRKAWFALSPEERAARREERSLVEMRRLAERQARLERSASKQKRTIEANRVARNRERYVAAIERPPESAASLPQDAQQVIG